MSKLFVVATPIGHLEDISPRALATLASVDCLFCENPNHTKKLLYHFKIKQSTFQIADFNEKNKIQQVLDRLDCGQNVALVSDAGTPLISDPGYAIVNACMHAGHDVIPIPGPSAVIAALSCSGLPTNRFSFEGFIPPKRTQRQHFLKEFISDPRTMVFYESPHRLIESLEDFCRVFGLMRIGVLTRELTKIHETVHRAPLGQLLQWVIEQKQAIGECTLIIQGADEILVKHSVVSVIEILKDHLSGKNLVNVVSQLCHCRKQTVYEFLNHQSK